MERKDELTLLGSKTEYRQDYAPSGSVGVLCEQTSRKLTIGYVLTVPNLPGLCPCAG